MYGNFKAISFVVLLVSMEIACRQPNRLASVGESSSSSRSPANLSKTPQSYADVVDLVAPAVVTVRSSRRVRAPEQFPFFNDPFLRQFFGGSLRSTPREQVERALGSGVIVRADGYILTNHHVVDGAEQIKVELSNRRTYDAKLVGSDAPSDLAVLHIGANNLPVLTLGNSDQVRVGDICLAVGNPLGVGETVTSGIVSAKERHTGLSNGAFQDFLQTDAPINQGNSGGALVNTTGALIGINSQIISTTGGSIGIGFAIPSNMAKTVMNQLISHGTVTRGHLGVSIQPMTSDLAASFGLKELKGVLVNSVMAGGPADKAGMKAGDVILDLDGKETNDPNSFRNAIAGTAPGATVTLTILRNGKQQEIRPKITEGANTPAGPTESGSAQNAGGKLGIAALPLTPQIASQIGVSPNTHGLVITNVNPEGPGANAGLQAGDVIEQINRQPVRSLQDIKPALAKSGSRPALLLINRMNQTVFVSVNPAR